MNDQVLAGTHKNSESGRNHMTKYTPENLKTPRAPGFTPAILLRDLTDCLDLIMFLKIILSRTLLIVTNMIKIDRYNTTGLLLAKPCHDRH